MAHPVVLNWPLLDTEAIALTQTLGGAGNLSLNGTLASSGFVTFSGFTRTVILDSNNNLSGVQFTITGTTNGLSVVEVIAGPNNNFVQTTAIFDVVLSISANNAAAGISAGIGTTGRTHWVKSNYHSTVANMGIQVSVTGTINYSFSTTLDEVQGISEDNITSFTPVTDLENETTNKLDGYFVPTHYSNITINSSDETGVLTATFLQQGID